VAATQGHLVFTVTVTRGNLALSSFVSLCVASSAGRAGSRAEYQAKSDIGPLNTFATVLNKYLFETR
jgi:hypothetical protein